MKKINKFENILSDVCYESPNGTSFYIQSHGVDSNKNPRYVLYMSMENILKIKDNKKNNFGGRVYDVRDEEKCRFIFTSYNLSEDIKFLFEICKIDTHLE